MNPRQLTVLWVGILAIVGMCLVPPWIGRYNHTVAGETDAGYHLLFKPPAPRTAVWQGGPKWDFRIDLSRLGIQCFGVALLAGGLLVSLHQKSSRDEAPTADVERAVPESADAVDATAASAMDQAATAASLLAQGANVTASESSPEEPSSATDSDVIVGVPISLRSMNWQVGPRSRL